MTLPLTPRLDRSMEPTTAVETTSTQLFGLAPILWLALPAVLAAPRPELPNASTYAWLPDNIYNKSVNSLSPLALDRTVFPRCTKKSPQKPAKPLNSLEDLAHTVDERFVVTYPVEYPSSTAPSMEETLINLDCLLAWCQLV
ncbi:hypothetical protein DSO57_1036940 [Entomophthora muscae]|uniref:Uncharacterized protein n=1 Tax=Entomophthora muscae TaxID=34485 RepID=A0ACC2TLK9_9FUNG|nr:hypothetical protein DSO57_1036940 [Entomophthora muscae]